MILLQNFQGSNNPIGSKRLMGFEFRLPSVLDVGCFAGCGFRKVGTVIPLIAGQQFR
jgi:hypothetical protein